MKQIKKKNRAKLFHDVIIKCLQKIAHRWHFYDISLKQGTNCALNRKCKNKHSSCLITTQIWEYSWGMLFCFRLNSVLYTCKVYSVTPKLSHSCPTCLQPPAHTLEKEAAAFSPDSSTDRSMGTHTKPSTQSAKTSAGYVSMCLHVFLKPALRARINQCSLMLSHYEPLY